MSFDAALYRQRRARLLQEIGPEGIAIVFAAPEQRRSNDSNFPFRQDSYLHYLTGFPEPEAVLVLDGAAHSSTLYCRDKDALREIWDGFRYGPEAAKDVFALEATASIDQWQSGFQAALEGHGQLWALWGLYPARDAEVLQLWQPVQQRAGQRAATVCTWAPEALMDLSRPLNHMRLYKDAHEIEWLRRAGSISAQGHVRAMQYVHPGVYEYQVEAELLHHFMQHGARHAAYNSIVGGGKNACCLHYVDNKDRLNDGELLLIDAGAEYALYAGDITRTFPVNGRFSTAQKDVYEIVLAANTEAIDAVRPGASWLDISNRAVHTLTQGLIDLGLLGGTVEDNVARETYKRFYMHGLGHWIGLDVHDVGGRFAEREPILLQPGMCTTVEPGLYIAAADDIPAHFHNIGVRIEDNVLVTAEGGDNYTHEAPKTVADIEALMAA